MARPSCARCACEAGVTSGTRGSIADQDERRHAMNRREFAGALAAGTVLSRRMAAAHAAEPSAIVAQATTPRSEAAPAPLTVAMLVHPDMVLLDLAGPQTVFSLLMAKVHLVWKDLKPVST